MDEDGMAVDSTPTLEDLESRLDNAGDCIAQLEDRVRELQGHVAWMTDKMRNAGVIDKDEGHHDFAPI